MNKPAAAIPIRPIVAGSGITVENAAMSTPEVAVSAVPIPAWAVISVASTWKNAFTAGGLPSVAPAETIPLSQYFVPAAAEEVW